jgi:hypothetical protein
MLIIGKSKFIKLLYKDHIKSKYEIKYNISIKRKQAIHYIITNYNNA